VIKSEDYKDSHSELIGEVPKHWEILKIKNIFDFSKGQGLSKSEVEDDAKSKCLLYGELFTRYKDINLIDEIYSYTNSDGQILSEGNELLIPGSTTTSGVDLANCKYLKIKDVILGGDIIILKSNLRKECDLSYISFYISTVSKPEFEIHAKGVTIFHIYPKQIREMIVTLPPLKEQQYISKYLDKKTKQIDSLVKKIQKKIELLMEQSCSLIYRCTTKGLDPKVEIINSGIECVDTIPKNWKISKYKYEITIQNGYPFKSELFNDEIGYPLIRIRDITSGQIETYYDGDPIPDYIVTKGDFLVGMDGDFNTRWWDGPDSLLNQRCCKIIEGSNYIRRYLNYLLPIQLKIINELTYFTTVKHLSSFDILETLTIVPPLNDQEKIVDFLDVETIKISKLIQVETKRLMLLKEYRQSLISSVVTGKLKITEDMI
jgi:restriction endonuclease S subunit